MLTTTVQSFLQLIILLLLYFLDNHKAQAGASVSNNFGSTDGTYRINIAGTRIIDANCDMINDDAFTDTLHVSFEKGIIGKFGGNRIVYKT